MLKWKELSFAKKAVIAIVVLLSIAAIAIGIWLAVKPKGNTEEEKQKAKDETSKGSTALWVILAIIGFLVFLGVILAMWAYKIKGKAFGLMEKFSGGMNSRRGDSETIEADGTTKVEREALL